MLISKRGFRIFNEYDLDASLSSQLSSAKQNIESNIGTISAEEEAEYIQRQTEKLRISPIEFNVNNLTVTTSQQIIPSEYFPSEFLIEPGERYPKEVYAFHLPFQGDPSLLRCVPSTRIMWTEEVAIENNEVAFEIINFKDDAEAMKNDRDRVVNYLTQQATNVNNQIAQYNTNLADAIRNAVRQVAGKLSKRSEILGQLGTPLKAETPKKAATDTAIKAKPSHVVDKKPKHFDVFICHASEDKAFVNSLAEEIKAAGIEPWYDDFQLGWGDDLRPAIDNGLKNSSYGIVVFSKAFFLKKQWTEHELNGLFAQEKKGKKVILPVWHEITREDMAAYSPTLVDRLAKRSDRDPVGAIVAELKKLLGK